MKKYYSDILSNLKEDNAKKILKNALEDIGFSCNLVTFSDAQAPDLQNLYARIGKSKPNFCFAGHMLR